MICKYFSYFLLIGLMIICYGCDLRDIFGGDEDPNLLLDPSSLSFGETLESKTFKISNKGGGTLDWWIEIDEESTWVSVNQDAGSNDTTITVSIDRSSLAPGEHTGILIVHSNGGEKTLSIHCINSSQGIITISGEVPSEEAL